MSLKLPKDLDFLEFSSVDSVDDVETGDLFVFPGLEAAPKLCVSISTLRKWGMSVKQYPGCFHCDYTKYETAGRLFCNPSGIRFFRVEGIVRNENHENCNKKSTRVVYENSNSIADCRETVLVPKDPVVFIDAYQVNPMFPLKGDVPSTSAVSSDCTAYDKLLSFVGKESIPTDRLEFVKLDRDGHPNLPYFLSALAAICECRLTSSVLPTKPTEIGTDLLYGSKSFDNPTAGRLVMTSKRSSFCRDREHVDRYFHNDNINYSKNHLAMPRRFVDNILARGSFIVRSEKFNDICSSIMAASVARFMHEQYRLVLGFSKRFAEGLTAELPKVSEICDKFDAAQKAIMPNEDEMKIVSKYFKEVVND